jgi:GT2 family glycosyltransferase
MTAIRCDLVVPVYNALRSTRDCLASIRRFAPSWARVVVVNDGSDRQTTEWLRAQEGIVLLENPVNLGFVQTANRGLVFSGAPYVCLLNSDTLVTEGALERIVARMDADRSIALCCPISNGAVNLSAKIPPGSDAFSFGRRVGRTAPAIYPDACTTVGFCLFFRREVIGALGVFDEVFGRGYCEETDYHYRCLAAGWRCVVADDAFVYHRHEGSFTDRDARFARNLRILMARWQRQHDLAIAEFNRRNELGAVRDRAYEWTLPDTAPEASDVLFVLPSFAAPGAESVLQLVDALLMRGTTANVVLLDESGLPPVELFCRPLVLSPDRLREGLPATRALIATDAVTAAAVALAAEGRPEIRVGLLESAAAVNPSILDLFPSRATFVPRAGATTIPLSPEPDLFYPRVRPAVPRLAVRTPLGTDLDEVSYEGLGWEKRAALFGSAHVVVEPDPDGAATALEAMSAGAVPVLVRRGSAEGVAIDGTDALFAAPEALAATARALARDTSLRERLAAAGIARARRLTWADAAEGFHTWYSALGPAAAIPAERRVVLARAVEARPRPPAPPPPARDPRFGVRARLGKLKRRLLARS